MASAREPAFLLMQRLHPDAKTLRRLLDRHGIVIDGGFERRPLSVVCRAYQRSRPNIPGYLKILDSPITKVQQNFRRELSILESLDGRCGAPALLQRHSAPDLSFHLCQLVEGAPIDRPLKGGMDDGLPSLLSRFRLLADRLVELHAEGIVHRDLSPDHVICASPCGIAILDYGMSRTIRHAQTDRRDRFIGTDLQCFGFMLWETICGRPVFPYRHPKLPAIISRELQLIEAAALPHPLSTFLVSSLSSRGEFTPALPARRRGFSSALQLRKAFSRLHQ